MSPYQVIVVATPVFLLLIAIVIACMAAQAIGRAAVLKDASAVGVAVGTVFFMLSDSLLAIDKFAVPLPIAEFLVLGTYYAAQMLIAHNARPGAATRAQSLNSSPALFGGVTPR